MNFNYYMRSLTDAQWCGEDPDPDFHQDDHITHTLADKDCDSLADLLAIAIVDDQGANDQDTNYSYISIQKAAKDAIPLAMRVEVDPDYPDCLSLFIVEITEQGQNMQRVCRVLLAKCSCCDTMHISLNFDHSEYSALPGKADLQGHIYMTEVLDVITDLTGAWLAIRQAE